MLKFLSKIFSGGDEKQPAGSDIAPTEYNGFTIQPCPQKDSSGWSTEAIVSREIDGEVKTHRFIRADKSGDQEGAVTLILSKSKMTIDQLGNHIFN